MDEGLPEGRLNGPAAFASLVRDLFGQAERLGLSHIRLCDPDFAGWPLGERPLVDDLTRWALAGGRLQMLGRDYRHLRLHAPRFVDWRRHFDHRFEARVLPRGEGESSRIGILTSDWVAIALDRPHAVWVSTSDRTMRAQMKQEWDSIWPVSSRGFPATTLGL